MTERWATLLANAAAGDGRGAPVLPSFPAILAELSPLEAALVEWLYRPYIEKDKGFVPRSLDGRGVQEIVHRLGFGDDDEGFSVLAENLRRLGLLETAWRTGGANLGGAGADMYPHYERLRTTDLGLHFVRACTVTPEAAGAQTGAQPG